MELQYAFLALVITDEYLTALAVAVKPATRWQLRDYWLYLARDIPNHVNDFAPSSTFL